MMAVSRDDYETNRAGGRPLAAHQYRGVDHLGPWETRGEPAGLLLVEDVPEVTVPGDPFAHGGATECVIVKQVAHPPAV